MFLAFITFFCFQLFIVFFSFRVHAKYCVFIQLTIVEKIINEDFSRKAFYVVPVDVLYELRRGLLSHPFLNKNILQVSGQYIPIIRTLKNLC